MLTADKVLVTVGTPCSLSAVGSTETYHARVAAAPEFIGFAAFDAGLVDIEQCTDGTLAWRWVDGEATSLSGIEARHGATLRANLGIRFIDELTQRGSPLDIAAPLPHDMAKGGLRRLAGLTFKDIRESSLKDMYGLFDDDPRLGPSLQSQLFMYAGLGALAALPVSLSQLLPNPFEFRVAAASAFVGMESLALWHSDVRDRFALRLASSLSSHGAALVSTMLAPAYSLSKSLKHPELLESLKSSSGYLRVPQTPMNSTGACASSSIAFCDLAPQMLFDYPGYVRPAMALWTAADAATQPDWGILEAFGPGALMTRGKLATMNESRAPDRQRPVAESLAPFDIDANGTVVGEGGSGVLITTLDFALRNFLDVTAIVAGWGQSGEAGGKAHFAGVGFGGENAIVHTLELAWRGHGYGVQDFSHLVAHATGTRTNSKTDLTTVNNARLVAAERQGRKEALTPMTVSTPKAIGDGHTMGETGLKAVAQAIHFLLGKQVVGVPTLRTLDPDLGVVAQSFVLGAQSITGDVDGGVLCATQGFGGYNGALALRAANAEAFARYSPDRKLLAAYLERWPELRREREQRERHWRLRRRSTLELAQLHHWHGLD